MDAVIIEVKNSIGFITLNRPDKFNAFNRNMALLFQKFLDQCASDPLIRCVVITGNGKAFSAGQDLSEVVDPEGPSMKQILSEHYNPIIQKIRALQKPVVAAVNGVAAGAAANIALCCDVVLASNSAAFIQAFSKIGLIPDSGGTFFLPRLVGWQKASALSMLGEKISASDAEKMGMVYKVFAEDSFAEEVNNIAALLASMPTKGLAFTKEALNHSLSNTMEQQLNLEDRLQQQASETYDYKEGVQAFLEKRKPTFKGA
ncbi:MAG: enoyl-CoA hydratase/isomerase family protein [Bacteroidetes bacterium]|nr:enoyl-CoA hydratase/isomerase family protein [Bacteroidota bacterium]